MFHSTHSSPLRGWREEGVKIFSVKKKGGEGRIKWKHAEQCEKSKRCKQGGYKKEKWKGTRREKDDTAEKSKRGECVCVISAVEEKCLTAIRRLLNDNLTSSLRWLVDPLFCFFVVFFKS